MSGEVETGKLRRLPSGRHGLTPEFVVRNHRERLTAGAIAAVAEYGFRDAGVTRIAAAAGVSRRTFYEYFREKESCCLDAYGVFEENLLRIVFEAGADPRGWTAKVRARVRALSDVLAANPNLVRFALLAPAAAGGEVREREREFLRKLLAELTAGVPEGRAYATPSEDELEALAGSVSSILAARATGDGASASQDVGPQLVELLLVPILGRPRAITEADKVRPDRDSG